MSAITDLLKETAELGIADIKKQMSQLDMNVTGKTASSLKAKVTGEKSVEISARKSILTLVFGRKPGKMPPVDEIREWAVAKGLPRGIEWAIAINISKFGTQIFQGVRPGLDIERTKKTMTEFFTARIGKIVAEQTNDLIITLYR